MQGTNILILNEATMQEALEYWLEHTWVGKKPVVKWVKPTSENSAWRFQVSLEEPGGSK